MGYPAKECEGLGGYYGRPQGYTDSRPTQCTLILILGMIEVVYHEVPSGGPPVQRCGPLPIPVAGKILEDGTRLPDICPPVVLLLLIHNHAR